MRDSIRDLTTEQFSPLPNPIQSAPCGRSYHVLRTVRDAIHFRKAFAFGLLKSAVQIPLRLLALWPGRPPGLSHFDNLFDAPFVQAKD